MVPRYSYEISRVSHYSGYCHVNSDFPYRTFTFFGLPSQIILVSSLNQLRSPLPHKNYFSWFGLYPFRSPLLGKSMFLSPPPITKMFQFIGFAHRCRCDRSPTCRVAPFGHLRIKSFLQIPAAFRSLTRPSSPPRA